MTSKDGEVGYKRPPKSGRFRPGQSGNPRGRKKGSANFVTDLEAELCEMVVVEDGGRECRVTKQRAIVKALIALAIKGDLRAISAIALFTEKSDRDDGKLVEVAGATADELEIMRTHFNRNLRQIPAKKDDEDE
jgi:hypothetical protein